MPCYINYTLPFNIHTLSLYLGHISLSQIFCYKKPNWVRAGALKLPADNKEPAVIFDFEENVGG